MKHVGTIKRIKPGLAGAGHWEIQAEPHVMMRLKKILPKTETQRRGSILLSDTPENAFELTWVLDRWSMKLTAADRRHLNAQTKEHNDHTAAVKRVLSGRRPKDRFRPVPADVEVDEYQYQGAHLAVTTGGTIVTDDLAMGKTRTGLLIFRYPQALPGLIVVEPHLLLQWQEELSTLLPWLKSHIIRSGVVYDPSKKREMKGEEPDILLSTYAKLPGWADHLAGKIKGVVYDECQSLRRRVAEKTKAAGQISDGANVSIGLSGTPVYNYGGEIYNVADVIRPGCLGDPAEFAREWGIGGGVSEDKEEVVLNSGGGLKVKSRALGRYLQEEGIILHRTWEGVGRKRPPKGIKIPHRIDADVDVVEEAESDATALAELILRQSGTRQEQFEAERGLDNKLRQATGVAKAPYVADFVRMLLADQEKVVVFAWHRAVYGILNERLEEFGPVMYTGTETVLGKRRSEKAFVEGDSRVLLMSLRSGTGLDGLQKVCNCGVLAELDFCPPINDQCLGRLPRPGQKKPSLGYILVANTGTDPGMVEKLGLKRMQSEPIRNPDAELIEPALHDTSDRVKKLAESVLERRELEAAA